MEVSETRSSARVAPRSLTREVETSAMTSSMVSACERMAPVHVASPTVRNRTVASCTASFGRGDDPLRDRQEHAVALDHAAPVGEVDGRKRDVLAPDVLPDVELGPVRQGEGAEVLTAADLAVVEVPELGALVAGVPLTEGVAKRENPLLGPRLVLVAPCAADAGVEAVGA